ncbi:hypothetical protein FQA39_LY16665 [Lamprigera yunnana]|nr:hypothetical protein FQA39_LY16665 [Lamprigera yunnana]
MQGWVSGSSFDFHLTSKIPGSGPIHWGEKYQHCFGKHQSPINIIEHKVQVVHLPPMTFTNFNVTNKNATLKNNGHTVMVTFDTEKKPMVSGGPLIGDYEFAQLHFHWGANDGEGSENTINNSSYPLEIHIVLYQQAYGSFQEATEHPDGLTVLSFLYTAVEEENENYKGIVEVLPLVKNAQTTTNVKELPALNNLITKDLEIYYFYGGSLTTPPCTEAVTWIEFKNTVPLGDDQSFSLLKLEMCKQRSIRSVANTSKKWKWRERCYSGGFFETCANDRTLAVPTLIMVLVSVPTVVAYPTRVFFHYYIAT